MSQPDPRAVPSTAATASLSSPRWVSVEAAAAHASVSRATIYRQILAGRVASSRLGRRRLVDLTSLDDLLLDRSATT